MLNVSAIVGGAIGGLFAVLISLVIVIIICITKLKGKYGKSWDVPISYYYNDITGMHEQLVLQLCELVMP